MREQQQLKTNSKYVKKKREIQTLEGASVFFIVSLFVLPQYFGIPLPVFDFTILRLAIVALLLVIFTETKLKDKFFETIGKASFSICLIPYIIVLIYTTVLRTDLNAILNPIIELLSLYLLIFTIRESIGFERAYKMFLIFIWILVILGIVEYILGETPFVHLKTINGIYTGRFVRSGQYRIMSLASHSLGYGLMLVTFPAFACYDIKKNRVDLFCRPLLYILMLVNVFLTGSRSTLGVFLLESIVIVLVSSKETRRKAWLIIILLLIIMVAFLIPFHNTSFGQFIMLQITSIIDTVFDTEYSLAYGANQVALSSSENYRNQLKLIYKVEWLNPLIGIGRSRSFSGMINGSYVKSVDDFYAAEYIRYAYPGLFGFVLFILSNVVVAVKKVFKDKSQAARLYLVVIAVYMLNLKWVDSLQTLKYLYVIFAMLECMPKEEHENKEPLKQKSKYIRNE